MPADVVETDAYPTAVQGPAGGDARTATSVRNMGSPLAKRSRWLKNRVSNLLGSFRVFAAADINISTNQITIAGHGLSTDDLVRFGNVGGTAFGVAGAALTLNPELSATPFYANVVDADTLRLTFTPGGSAVDITSIGSGDHYMWVVPKALHSIMHPSFTNLDGKTIPGGPLYATLAAYFISTLGSTMVGRLKHSGAAAYKVDRNGSVADTLTQTITPTDKDWFQAPDFSQDSTIILSDPPEAGIEFDITRMTGVKAFKGDFVRDDLTNTLVARFPASAKAEVTIRSGDTGDGLGLAWHTVMRGSTVTSYS